MKTPAVVFAEPGRVEIREMVVREPGPGEVGVRTLFSGVSQGTERWALTGRYDQFAREVTACYPRARCHRPARRRPGIPRRTSLR